MDSSQHTGGQAAFETVHFSGLIDAEESLCESDKVMAIKKKVLFHQYNVMLYGRIRYSKIY